MCVQQNIKKNISVAEFESVENVWNHARNRGKTQETKSICNEVFCVPLCHKAT